MKNTKRFHTGWLMLLLSMPLSLPLFAEPVAETAVEEGASNEGKATASGDAPAEISNEAFLQQELLEMYRQDEVVITYFFMDQFFPLLIEKCDQSYQKAFTENYPAWQKLHKEQIDSGNSIIRGRFSESPEHVEQAMYFALQHLQMQSEEFQQSLCKEVVRTVTVEKE